MSREITKRFAAIGDELSPPKPKPAPKRVTMGNNTELREAKIDWRELERCERERVVAELGPGLDTNVIDGIVQAALELANAQLINDQNKVAWWRQRLDYIREQARKQSRGMLASPLGVPMTSSLIESFKTMDWAQQEIANVTGIKQAQEMDYFNDCLVVRTQYVDGKVSMERIDRRSMEDNSRFAACNKCGQPRFYPDGKTYHLCPATTKSYRIPPGGGVSIVQGNPTKSDRKLVKCDMCATQMVVPIDQIDLAFCNNCMRNYSR